MKRGAKEILLLHWLVSLEVSKNKRTCIPVTLEKMQLVSRVCNSIKKDNVI